ncbi:MAG: HEXXH motif-containing putative peptide modification protein [Thermogemmata sp.]|nr:HEXXH motif-containing putative peptide modification protein [Thermogemmata sp.]
MVTAEECAISEFSKEDLQLFNDPTKGAGIVKKLQEQFAKKTLPLFLEAVHYTGNTNECLRHMAEDLTQAPLDILKMLAIQPSIYLWTTVTRQHALGIQPTDISGEIIPARPDYIQCIHNWFEGGLPPFPRLHRNDPFLRLPFSKRIIFEPPDHLIPAVQLAKEALKIIGIWDPALLEEIRLISPEIQFIRDPSAHPDKAVSFSDNSVPGALYISVRRGDGWISVYDLADSIIHEHRHQKLYLLQSIVPIVAVDAPLVRSPWREDMRPPSGLFHAVFVFSTLLKYWQFIQLQSEGELKKYAKKEATRIKEQLEAARPILLNTKLTRVGYELARVVYEEVTSLDFQGI